MKEADSGDLDNDHDDEEEEDGAGSGDGVGYDDTLEGQISYGEQAGESGNRARKRKPRKRGPAEDSGETGQLKLPF